MIKFLIGLNCTFIDWTIYLVGLTNPEIDIFDFVKKDCLKTHLETNEYLYILPLSDFDFDNIMCVRNQMSNFTSTILYPTLDIANLFNDKINFNKYMLKNYPNNIPKIFVLEGIYMNLPTDEYKYIIKPRFSTNGNGMKICDFQTLDHLNVDKIDIIQEYIEDEYEYGGFFFCINGKIINFLILKEKFNPMYIKQQNFENYEIVENFDLTLFEQILLSFNYNGGANFDFKMFDGQIKIFEINPRFGGSLFFNKLFADFICKNV